MVDSHRDPANIVYNGYGTTVYKSGSYYSVDFATTGSPHRYSILDNSRLLEVLFAYRNKFPVPNQLNVARIYCSIVGLPIERYPDDLILARA